MERARPICELRLMCMFNARRDKVSQPTHGGAGERTFEPRSQRVVARSQPLILSNIILTRLRRLACFAGNPHCLRPRILARIPKIRHVHRSFFEP